LLQYNPLDFQVFPVTLGPSTQNGTRHAGGVKVISEHEAEFIMDGVHTALYEDFAKRHGPFSPAALRRVITQRGYGPSFELLHREGALKIIIDEVEAEGGRLASSGTNPRFVAHDNDHPDRRLWIWKSVEDNG
jgi:hypothetical protein